MSNHVYKILELTGSSTSGIEDAVSTAIAKAGETVRNMQWFEVVELVDAARNRVGDAGVVGFAVGTAHVGRAHAVAYGRPQRRAGGRG